METVNGELETKYQKIATEYSKVSLKIVSIFSTLKNNVF